MIRLFKDLFADLGHKGLCAITFVALIIFVFSVLLGYSVPASERQKTVQEVENLIAPLKGLNDIWLAVFIFFNNSLKALFTIFTGLFLGLGPLAFITFNGFLLGMVVQGTLSTYGPFITFLSLFPHGILEVPSIILSAAMGFYLGKAVIQKLRKRDVKLRKEMKLSLSVFITVILPALVLASLVEVYITRALVESFK